MDLAVIFGKFLLAEPLGGREAAEVASQLLLMEVGAPSMGEGPDPGWWFPSWVMDPVLGLSVPSSGPHYLL